MVDLSTDGSAAAGSGAGGLDMFGQQATNANRSTPAGNCQDIDAVFNRNSDASGISADGTVIVGEMQVGSPYGLSRASATSQDGSVVVGTSLTTGSSDSARALIWTARCGMRGLQTALKNRVANLPSGWILQIATDVSEGGTVITGWGLSPPVPGSTAGQTQPWRATLPAPC